MKSANNIDLRGGRLLNVAGLTDSSGNPLAAGSNVPFTNYTTNANTALTLTAAHNGYIIVLTNANFVVVTVPKDVLQSNFYCRIVSTTTGGFRVSAATDVTVVSPVTGYLAVRSINADADLYTVGTNKYILKSGYLGPAFPLNALPQPLLAVSVSRRITEQYTGDLLLVRRSSDNTTQGVGTSGDALDTTGLASFVGSGNGYVQRLYDQSGNGRHLTQTDTGKQPRIAGGGTLDQAGGRAALRAFASGTYLDTPLSVTGTTLTVVGVGVMNSATPNYGRLVSLGQSGQNDYDSTQYTAAIRREQTEQKLRTDRSGTQYFDAQITYGTPFSYVLRFDGSQVSLFLNGGAAPVQNSSGQFNISTLRLFASMQLGGEYWDGHLCELLVFGSALTDAQIGAIYTDQKAYYGLS